PAPQQEPNDSGSTGAPAPAQPVEAALLCSPLDALLDVEAADRTALPALPVFLDSGKDLYRQPPPVGPASSVTAADAHADQRPAPATRTSASASVPSDSAAGPSPSPSLLGVLGASAEEQAFSLSSSVRVAGTPAPAEAVVPETGADAPLLRPFAPRENPA